MPYSDAPSSAAASSSSTGQRAEEAAEHENGERQRQRDIDGDQPLVGVDHLQVVEQQEKRHQQKLERDAHARDEGEHDQLAAAERDPAEHVGRGRRERQDQRGGDADDHQAIEEVIAHARELPGLGVVLEVQDRGQGPCAGEQLAVALERGDHDPDKGEDGERDPEYQEDPGGQAGQCGAGARRASSGEPPGRGVHLPAPCRVILGSLSVSCRMLSTRPSRDA